MQSILIIGGGTAGLIAAYYASLSGFKVKVLEKEKYLGHSWRKRHPQLCLNTHKHLSSLPGTDYVSGTGSFPSRDSVIKHINDFANFFSIPIEYGVEIEQIEYLNDSIILHSNHGRYSASNVIVATGRDKKPFMPNWQGRESFNGKVIHAADFGPLTDYEGKRVLVVGAGNSGFDLLNHLSKVSTRELWLSARGGTSILPKRITGLAVHRLSTLMSRLPIWFSDNIISFTQRLAFGDLTKFGLPKSLKGGATRLANDNVALAIDDGAVKAIRAGLIKVIPEIKEFTPDKVILTDGSSISADIVITATGYRPGLEKLVGGLGVLGNHGIPIINGGECSPEARGLWFIGMRASITGDIYSAKQQAKAIICAIKQKTHNL